MEVVRNHFKFYGFPVANEGDIEIDYTIDSGLTIKFKISEKTEDYNFLLLLLVDESSGLRKIVEEIKEIKKTEREKVYEIAKYEKRSIHLSKNIFRKLEEIINKITSTIKKLIERNSKSCNSLFSLNKKTIRVNSFAVFKKYFQPKFYYTFDRHFIVFLNYKDLRVKIKLIEIPKYLMDSQKQSVSRIEVPKHEKASQNQGGKQNYFTRVVENHKISELSLEINDLYKCWLDSINKEVQIQPSMFKSIEYNREDA